MVGTAIFWPMILQVALTLLLYFLTFRVRVALVKKGEAKTSDFRTYENEVSESRKWARAIANQFELPILFYVVCLAAFVIGTAGGVMLVLAWAYSIVKTAHVFLHVTSNRLRYRQPVFSVSVVILMAMWAWFALSILFWV